MSRKELKTLRKKQKSVSELPPPVHGRDDKKLKFWKGLKFLEMFQ